MWVNGIRAINLPGLNNERGSSFRVSAWVIQETPEKDRKTYRFKRCEYNIYMNTIIRKRWMFKQICLN